MVDKKSVLQKIHDSVPAVPVLGVWAGPFIQSVTEKFGAKPSMKMEELKVSLESEVRALREVVLTYLKLIVGIIIAMWITTILLIIFR